MKTDPVEILRGAGMANPAALPALIQHTILTLKLDLSGLVVLTEAASGPFVVTPVIASLAGARRVIALTADSRHAKSSTVIEQTRSLESLCGLKDSIEIHTDKSSQYYSQADIITNLGFVRPIERANIEAMKPTAVIPLMCESWEYRPGDIDFEACNEKSVLILGTNEHYPGLNVFQYCGWLCIKMLFDANVEIFKQKILVVSSDLFGITISNQLHKSGIDTTLIEHLNESHFEKIKSADVIIIADYLRDDFIIGSSGDLSVNDFASLAPTVTVIQFAGKVDVGGLKANGIHVYPGIPLESHRMAFTLAHLGPRPVIELHAAGLKVGQIGYKAKNYHPNDFIEYLREKKIVQLMNR